MDSLLLELGVVNGDETDMMFKVQSMVEENEAAKAVAGKATNGDEGTHETIAKGTTRVDNVGVNKRSVLESIMDGANAALDLPAKALVHTQAKGYKKIEKVKFISVLEDIPNTHEKEMRFSGAKRGFYDASTSLNLFSNANGGGVQQYRNSTNVDNEALLSIVRDAKAGSRTKGAKTLLSEALSEGEELDGEDGSLWQTEGVEDQIVEESVPASSEASSSRDIVCPICNRNLGHGDSAAQNTVILDRHVERCARRGSRNVTNYALAGNDSPGEEESQFMTSSRPERRTSLGSGPKANVKSSSSSGRVAAGSRKTPSSTKSSAVMPGQVSDDAEVDLDFALFDDESLAGSDWEGGGNNQKNNGSSRGDGKSSSAPPTRSTRSTRSSVGDMNKASARPRTSYTVDSDSEAEFDGDHPVQKRSATSNNKPTKPIAKSTSRSSLNSNTSNVSDEDEALGFVASIVDDWEDAAYDHRLALVAEAYEQSKSKANKRRRLEKARKKQALNVLQNGVTDDDGVDGTSLGAGSTENGDEDDSEYVRTDYGTEMLRSTYEKLHQYQRDGCRWLHELYEEGVGGILGDEMGLGKTAQVCSHFGSLGLLHNENAAASHAARPLSSLFIVVCPATVLHHWLQEFHHWAPFMRVVVLHSVSATASELLKLGNLSIPRVLRKLQRKHNTRGLVVITTYEGLRKHRQDLVSLEWTAVCLDEGQKIRNPSTEITSTCKMLPAFHRIILSGTPIQNSLRELWSLFDFIYPGRLGSLVVFEQEFATPIRMGGYANANALQYEIAIRCASTLQRIVKPYLLRRKKDDLITVTNLPPKTEQVLFCQISPRQREIYLNIIESSEVKAVLQRKMMAFRAINTLRKLCNHPALVFQQGKIVWQQDPLLEATRTGPGGSGNGGGTGGVGMNEDGEVEEADDGDADAVQLLNKVGSGGLVWADSGKLLVLSKLLPLWYTEGHKVLIFSQTRGMLSVIESMVRELGFLYLRMDGSTPVGKRAGLVNGFNTEKNIFVMLLTTRTGGVGISLTAANRVVLFDPDWNPMTDMQSRERAWRLGQKREVTVYRLITRGTIEEKIYQRQIFKLLLSNRILENSKQKALFSQTHMRELFELNDSFCKGGQDRHGYEVGGEALPMGAEVSMKKTEATNDESKPSTTSAKATVDTGASTSSSSSSTQRELQQRLGDANLVQIEEYSEAPPLPAELMEEIESSEAPAADGSNSRDRRLLQALFAGDAITSVYDHHFFDPTGNAATDKSRVGASANLKAGAARVARRAEADNAVDRALSELQASATGYRTTPAPMRTAASATNLSSNSFACGRRSNNNSSTNLSALNILSGRQEEADLSHPYVAPMPGPTAAAAGPNASNGARPRFGASSATMSGPSSASLLAGLSNSFNPSAQQTSLPGNGNSTGNPFSTNARFTANNNNVDSRSANNANGGSTFHQVSGGARVVRLPQTTVADPSAVSNSTTPGASSSARVTVRDDILNRLTQMFGRADRPLTTAFVLSRFKDLGDQYAPLFRELLRSVAMHNNGVWSKKK